MLPRVSREFIQPGVNESSLQFAGINSKSPEAVTHVTPAVDQTPPGSRRRAMSGDKSPVGPQRDKVVKASPGGDKDGDKGPNLPVAERQENNDGNEGINNPSGDRKENIGKSPVPKRFGEPSAAPWSNSTEYFNGRNERVNSELFGIVKQSITNSLFPPSDSELSSRQIEQWRAFRARYKIVSPEDSRIDAAARFFLGATYALEEAAKLLGAQVTLEVDTTSPPEGTVTSNPVFTNNTRAPAIETYLFRRKDGSSIASKEITRENMDDCELGQLTIIINMTYAMLHRLSDEAAAEQLRMYHERTPVGKRLPVTIETILSAVDDELNAAFDAGAIESLVHCKDISEKAKSPEGLLELAQGGSGRLEKDQYLEHSLEIAVKGWTLEFLNRFYPNSQTRKIIEQDYEKQEAYLVQLSTPSAETTTPEKRTSERRPGGKKKKKKRR